MGCASNPAYPCLQAGYYLSNMLCRFVTGSAEAEGAMRALPGGAARSKPYARHDALKASTCSGLHSLCICSSCAEQKQKFVYVLNGPMVHSA